MQYKTTQYKTTQYKTTQYKTTQYKTTQYKTTQYRPLHHDAVLRRLVSQKRTTSHNIPLNHFLPLLLFDRSKKAANTRTTRMTLSTYSEGVHLQQHKASSASRLQQFLRPRLQPPNPSASPLQPHLQHEPLPALQQRARARAQAPPGAQLADPSPQTPPGTARCHLRPGPTLSRHHQLHRALRLSQTQEAALLHVSSQIRAEASPIYDEGSPTLQGEISVDSFPRVAKWAARLATDELRDISRLTIHSRLADSHVEDGIDERYVMALTGCYLL
jgi:hypothetical protein